MILNFLFALQFLTIIPVKMSGLFNEEKLSQSVIYFPLIGILLGLLLAGLNLIFSFFAVPMILTNTALVVTLIILTGGLHLDGLADTADAFLSGKKERENLLEILRDPHIGAMGVLSLISVILLKIALVSSVDESKKGIAIILMCFLSRAALILPLYLFKYARNEGKAKIFFGSLNIKKCILLNTAVLLFSFLVAGWNGVFIFSAVVLCTYFFTLRINKRLDGLTGDILGASVELNELLILTVYFILMKA